MDDAGPTSSRDRVRAHRAKLRAQGLRPFQIWLPDMDSPEFLAEARRQSLLIAHSPHETADQAFVDAITRDLWDTLPPYDWGEAAADETR